MVINREVQCSNGYIQFNTQVINICHIGTGDLIRVAIKPNIENIKFLFQVWSNCCFISKLSGEVM